MLEVSWIIGLMMLVSALSLVARRFQIPYPTLMVLGGLFIGMIPNLPEIHIPPEVMLLVFLPPLLYAAAWSMPWQEFRANLRPISLLALGLVIATTVVVAVVAHTVIDGLPWSAAFVLGAIVSPPDAVAATTITKTMSVPRRMVVILEGESLVNDATGLVAYRLALVATVTGIFDVSSAISYFMLASCGGVLIGLLVGLLVRQIHRRLEDPLLETVITILTPFAAYLPAELLHVSGVLATVTAGLFMRRQAGVLFSSTTRLQATAVWDVLVFLLNGLAFVLIGLQLRGVIETVIDELSFAVVGWAVLILFTTMAVRMAWIFPAAWLPRQLFTWIRNGDPMPSWQSLLVIGWTGMRGVVSLAAALALPMTIANGSPFPYRDVIIFLTFIVVLGTLTLQSLTLGPLIRWLNIAVKRTGIEAEVDARLAMATAAIRYVELHASSGDRQLGDVEYLRRHFELQASHALSRLAEEHPEFHTPLVSTRSLYAGALKAQRYRLEEIEHSAMIDHEVVSRLEREIDLEETRLRADAPG